MANLWWFFILSGAVASSGQLFNFRNNACKRSIDYTTWFWNSNCHYNPDVDIGVPKMITMANYSLEIHKVKSANGYILTLFRVLSKNGDPADRKLPIFVHHGICTNSGVFTDKGQQSHAFILADRGYDVWLANARGTTYSQEHAYLTVNDEQYWNYTLDNMALEDVSAMIKYVSTIIRKPGSIVYIGHSMGTTLGFMYASGKPGEAHRYLQGIIALSPVVYLEGAKWFELYNIIVAFLRQLGLKGVFYHEQAVHSTIQNLCKFVAPLCIAALDLTYGESHQFDAQDLLLYFSQNPTGTSLNQFQQYIQINKANKFGMFDYGLERNLQIYGQRNPPKYDLGAIVMPVYLFSGKADILATDKNARRLLQELGSSDKELINIPREGYGYNHIDFLYARNIMKDLYFDLLTVLDCKFK